MKILYIEPCQKYCNYYSDIIKYLKQDNIVNVVSNANNANNNDIVIVGFSATDTGGNKPNLNLNNINKPLYIILNKEYDALPEKLIWIKEISPPPKKIFTVHHDFKKYENFCKIPFDRIMWSACHDVFKKYSNDYKYDFFFSGVIRPEQTENLRFKIFNKLNELNKYKLLTKTANFNNNVLTGKLNTFNIIDYAKCINDSKIILSTTGPADLVGTRYFEIMASNKALILCNRMPENVYEKMLIDKFNCVMFDDEDDFIKKCIYYLDNENERMKIVNTAYDYFTNNLTWNHQVNKLMTYINN